MNNFLKKSFGGYGNSPNLIFKTNIELDLSTAALTIPVHEILSQNRVSLSNDLKQPIIIQEEGLYNVSAILRTRTNNTSNRLRIIINDVIFLDNLSSNGTNLLTPITSSFGYFFKPNDKIIFQALSGATGSKLLVNSLMSLIKIKT